MYWLHMFCSHNYKPTNIGSKMDPPGWTVFTLQFQRNKNLVATLARPINIGTKKAPATKHWCKRDSTGNILNGHVALQQHYIGSHTVTGGNKIWLNVKIHCYFFISYDDVITWCYVVLWWSKSNQSVRRINCSVAKHSFTAETNEDVLFPNSTMLCTHNLFWHWKI